MSQYVRRVKFTTEFDGDTVTMFLKPIKRKDVLDIRDSKDAAGVLTFAELGEKFAKLLPEYVEEFEGLTDQAGSPVSLEDVCQNAYFMSLVIEVGKALLQGALPANPKGPATP